MKFQENVLLKNYTSFKIGGPARYFFIAKNKDDLIKAVDTAKRLNLPFFILGGGSNLLVSDQGYNGLVIKIQNSKFKIQNSKIICEAGTPLSFLVSKGLEWAIGIPGTVGGAVYGNAGAFGKSMKDIVKSVEVLEIKFREIGSPMEIRSLKNKDCQFGYRNSVFKQNKNLIIISAELKFKKGNKKEIKEKIKNYVNQKKETQPMNFPSAGSVFKNPVGFFAGELGEENKFSSSSFAAARLIEKCGLKGKKIGDVKISEKHANFIVNLGKGRAEDVKKLIKLIKKSVKNKFKINLEEEIEFL